MVKRFLSGALGICLGLVAGNCWGAIVATWNFTNGTSGIATEVGTISGFSLSAMSIGNSAVNVSSPIGSGVPSSVYSGASGTNNISNAFRLGALNVNADGSGFLEFTVTNNSVNSFIRLTDFDFGRRSTSTGPQSFSLRTGTTFSSEITTGSIANDSAWAFANNTFSPYSIDPGASAVFRLYGFGGTGTNVTGVNGRFDDLVASFDAVAVPEPSSLVLLAMGGIGGVIYRRRRAAKAVTKELAVVS